MFRIYIHSSEWKSFKRFLWKSDSNALLFLTGINIQGSNIFPVYTALMRSYVTPGMLYFETPRNRLILMRRPPYIHFERTQETTVENEDD